MMRWLRKIVEKRDDKEILSMDSEKRIAILEKELKKLKESDERFVNLDIADKYDKLHNK